MEVIAEGFFFAAMVVAIVGSGCQLAQSFYWEVIKGDPTYGGRRRT